MKIDIQRHLWFILSPPSLAISIFFLCGPIDNFLFLETFYELLIKSKAAGCYRIHWIKIFYSENHWENFLLSINERFTNKSYVWLKVYIVCFCERQKSTTHSYKSKFPQKNESETIFTPHKFVNTYGRRSKRKWIFQSQQMLI